MHPIYGFEVGDRVHAQWNSEKSVRGTILSVAAGLYVVADEDRNNVPVDVVMTDGVFVDELLPKTLDEK